MLSLILWYIIGKQFNKLALQYRREAPWKSVVMGILWYLFGMVISIFAIVFIGALYFDLDLDSSGTVALGYLGLPIGLAACYGYYVFLKRKFSRDFVDLEKDLENIGQDGNEVDILN